MEWSTQFDLNENFSQEYAEFVSETQETSFRALLHGGTPGSPISSKENEPPTNSEAHIEDLKPKWKGKKAGRKGCAKGETGKRETFNHSSKGMEGSETVKDREEVKWQTGHWSFKETIVLLDGRKALLEEMSEGPLLKRLRGHEPRWEFVSKFCLDRKVYRDALQCNYRWDRIYTPFKKVFDYENHLPSGADSYWQMTADVRGKNGLPKYFTWDLYEALSQRFRNDRSLNPGDILVDSSVDIAGPCKVELKEDVAENEDVQSGPSSSGKKRKKASMTNVVKKELGDTTKELIGFFDAVENKRIAREKELEVSRVVREKEVEEITKEQFEINVNLARERLAIEEQGNHALMEIASALKAWVFGSK